MYPVLENRAVWIEVDIDQFTVNLTYAKKLAGEKEIWAVVKANAYNHGIEGLFDHFVAAGITHFCVGNYDEADHLQMLADAAKVDIMILILGGVPINTLGQIPRNWSVTISDSRSIVAYTQALKATPDHIISVQVKVDSGMNRRGFKDKESFNQAIHMVKEHAQFELIGLFTHFATANSDQAYMQKQVQTFLHICGDVTSQVRYVHAQNSHGLLQLGSEADHFNVVRIGGLCYGMTGQAHDVVLPILSLYGEVVEVKAVKKGEPVGYGNTYICPSNGYIGIVPIGYSDGWRTSNTQLPVQANDIPSRIVGRICMEQMMIFTPSSALTVGDTVELIGNTSDFFAVAAHNQISDYELVCGLHTRIPRKYISTRKGG